MTEMPIEHAARAAVTPPPPAAHLSSLGHLHRDLANIGRAAEHAWPIIHAAAANPRVDQLVEAALEAAGLGVEAHAFEAAIDLLRGASKRKAQGAGPQPAFLPAPAPFPQGTGPFPPARVLGIGELFPPAHAEDAGGGM